MKIIILTSLLFCFCFNLQAQQATEINVNAITLPRFANASAVNTAIPNPVAGMIIYRNDTQSFWFRNATTWVNLSASNNTQWTSVGNDIYNTNFGNVGIGMSAPNAPLQFSNSLENRKIVLYENSKNDHQYYGFGINGGTLRYQSDATGADHVFFAASSSVSSNELMRVRGVGQIQVGGASSSGRIYVVGNSTFKEGVYASTSFDGAAVYGSIDGGTTRFAGVQGEYKSSTQGVFSTAGVRGNNLSSIAGTGFRNTATTGPRAGVIGNTTVSNGQYTFGLHGTMGSTDIRCGGVFGDDFGLAFGSLGYFAANLVDYGVYGFGRAFEVGTAGGRKSYRLTEPNTQIGLGIYGGVMGGWIRGLVYGTHIKGEQYSLYVDGKTYVNEPIAELVSGAENNRTPAFALTTFGTDIYAKGKAKLEAGKAVISFQANFKAVISENPEDIVITVAPSGKSKGLYIESQSADGFVVKENDGGEGITNFSWIAIATRKDKTQIEHPSEVLAPDFDSKMNSVMYNDNNTDGKQKSIWWDGTRVRFDTPQVERSIDGIDRSRKGNKN
ncbi:MAG: hypothetical protein ACK4NY_18695 [Spirosomataceae bacterium]